MGQPWSERLRRISGAAVVVVLSPIFLADFILAASRMVWWRLRSRDLRESERLLDAISGVFFITLYRWLPTPHIRFSGLPPSLDALYDGRFVLGVSQWWNSFLTRRPAISRLPGVQRADHAGLEGLQRTVSPDNRDALVAVAHHIAPFPELAEAAMALSYTCARVFSRGVGSDYIDQPQDVTLENFANNQNRYSFIHGSNFLDGPKTGYWLDLEAGYWGKFVTTSLRWAYGDQVRRWEEALGHTMGSGIGFGQPDQVDGSLVNKYSDLLFEYGGRFYEAEEVQALTLRGDGAEPVAF